MLVEFTAVDKQLAPRCAVMIALDGQARVRSLNTTVSTRKLSHLFAPTTRVLGEQA